MNAVVPAPARPSRRGWILLATLLGVAITARLGWWQLDRAAQKIALRDANVQRMALPALPAAELATSRDAAEAQHHRRIELTGQWVAAATVFLDNRQMNGHQGFYVVTPLRLAAGDAVLVQRGWVPRDFNDRTRLPTVDTPTGEVHVTGRIAPPPTRLHEFAADEHGAIRQNLDLASFAREIRLPLRPLSIVQIDEPSDAPSDAHTAAPDGLLRQWPQPAVDVQMHYGYAFQWFSMAALMAGLYVWFQLIRPRIAARRAA